MRVRFGAEVAGAATAGVLAIVTLFSRDWVEVLFRVDPDHGSGVLEWALVVALAVISIVLTRAARCRWRQLRIVA